MSTKDQAGTSLLTRADVFNALTDGKTIQMSTEFGVDTIRVSGKKPYLTATVDGKGKYSVSALMEVYGSYHYEFGANVLFPMNVKEL